MTEIPLSADIEGYNEGYVAAAEGEQYSLNYWLKWASAQQGYAFVDTVVTPALKALRVKVGPGRI